jgi:hypothetical protein
MDLGQLRSLNAVGFKDRYALLHREQNVFRNQFVILYSGLRHHNHL